MSPVRRRRPRHRGLLAAAWLLLAAAPAAAQDEATRLAPPVRGSLHQLQERWNGWLAAFYQDDAERAAEITEGLRGVAQGLGMRALPDLSRAALARGVEAARRGDFARARWALASAERLDPARPETAFAHARVDRLQGRWGAASVSYAEGIVRSLGQPLESRLWGFDLLAWALCALLLAGTLFVALAAAVHGAALGRDLGALVGRFLPPAAILPATVVVLLWPLVLPAGLAWLVLWWSILVWGYGSRSQRVVLAALWFLVAALPPAVEAGRRRIALELSPPVRAMDELAAGRLAGGLFSDLGALRATLPEAPAVDHLFADLYRRVGDRERSRLLYREVLAVEPENADALIDLGAYYFYRGDYRTAIDRFEAAARVAPDDPRAFFDLSQAYSNAYLFTDSRRALAHARELGDLEVSRWMQEVGDRGVKSADGGLARIEEIRGRLAAGTGARAGRVVLLRQGWGLLAALGALLAAVGTARLLRDAAPAPPAGGPPRARRGGFREALEDAPWARALVPGGPSLAAGRGVLAYLALLPVSALLLLPLLETLGVTVPTAYAAWGVGLPLAVAGFTLLAAGRAFLAFRAER